MWRFCTTDRSLTRTDVARPVAGTSIQGNVAQSSSTQPLSSLKRRVAKPTPYVARVASERPRTSFR